MNMPAQIAIREETLPARPPLRVLATAPVEGRLRPAGDALPGLVPAWRELVDEASEPNSFAEPWFVAAALDTLGQGCGISLFEAWRGERLIGVLPIAFERGYARLPVRHVQNWLHHQSFLGTPLVVRGEEETFWAALLDTLDRAPQARNLLHLKGLVEGGPVHQGLLAAAAATGRPAATVYRETRAMLATDLPARAYYEAAIRPKKRKEMRRLQARLSEVGEILIRRLGSEAELDGWCDAFLALEKAGWKGRAGSALACDPVREAFFRRAVRGAWNAGRLDFLRLDLDRRPLAMLVSFLAAPGSFSFKTCFDEDYARFSPGVLLQIENLSILQRFGLEWADSCAIENHNMIDSLWSGRRRIVRVTIALAGARDGLVHGLCRGLEKLSVARQWLSTRRDA
jgi:CelD/BcsL family acetyltransferase involved in cellulose biosynthesis